jgi:hypothetical protein
MAKKSVSVKESMKSLRCELAVGVQKSRSDHLPALSLPCKNRAAIFCRAAAIAQPARRPAKIAQRFFAGQCLSNCSYKNRAAIFAAQRPSPVPPTALQKSRQRFLFKIFKYDCIV